MLRGGAPSPKNPIRLYASTTENLSNVCYTAEIIGWEDKRVLSARRKKEVNAYLREYQQDETDLFDGVQEAAERSVNLITIQNLLKLDSLSATSVLTKVSDNLPLQRRSRAGGWSEVFDVGDLLALPSQIWSQAERELAAEIKASFALNSADRAKRLANAPKMPERVQFISMGFRRNADVIVTVLVRANGVCEKCGQKAPFIRRSDGSPYLEVHHWIPLGQGGEDTVKNAAALCPNCHREVHHA
jgi:hypothetical protein